MRIGLVAPGRPLLRETAESVQALAAAFSGVELVFHPHCFERWGHFAGRDETRIDAFAAFANDPAFDALWFAAGGYGAARILDAALPRLEARARDKIYLGYSDAGFLLAALHKQGFPWVAHGPMPVDMLKPNGAEAVRRALSFLALRAEESVEPNVRGPAPAQAYNITILRSLIGTPHQPILAGKEVLLEDVSEHLYAIDRSMFQLAASGALHGARGVRLGRVSDVPENDVPFPLSAEAIVRHWCAEAGAPYLGAAEIGHDAGNHVVPFGGWTRWREAAA